MSSLSLLEPWLSVTYKHLLKQHTQPMTLARAPSKQQVTGKALSTALSILRVCFSRFWRALEGKGVCMVLMRADVFGWFDGFLWTLALGKPPWSMPVTYASPFVHIVIFNKFTVS
eukprot:TRINITY_DN2928_c0_g2_i1.p1 TRINITY_DN2928_c0_g2~~TRINITY_DN2928_c0_g2_i1.p1  ORF type:complete len:115 (+),score=2.39 TRINITY_DN2928_c0_g2_i1:482-826(+)